MNRTLYALTLVTVIVLPFSILTGLFGMNFEDMAELSPLSANGGEGTFGPSLLPITGYNMFWSILLSIQCKRQKQPARECGEFPLARRAGIWRWSRSLLTPNLTRNHVSCSPPTLPLRFGARLLRLRLPALQLAEAADGVA